MLSLLGQRCAVLADRWSTCSAPTRVSFSDLLRAVFHLTEELTARTDLAALPETDIAHLVSDTERAYVLMVHEWLDY